MPCNYLLHFGLFKNEFKPVFTQSDKIYFDAVGKVLGTGAVYYEKKIGGSRQEGKRMWEGNWCIDSPDDATGPPENWGVYSATEWKERFPVTKWTRSDMIDFLSNEDYENDVINYASPGYAYHFNSDERKEDPWEHADLKRILPESEFKEVSHRKRIILESDVS